MRAIAIIGVVLLAGTGLAAQDPLSTAKDQYASAAYEDALSTLSRMDGGSTAPDVARQVEEYRAFCLYALGRTREAESVAESMIRKQPLARLDAADASPRLEMMFADVRKRLLPSLIRDRFRTARTALDQKSYSTAEPSLTEAKLMIAEAEKLGVRDDGLGDLSVLVDGFLHLVKSAAEQEQRTASRPEPVAVVASIAEVPAVAPRQSAPPPAAAPRPVSTSGSPAPASRAASTSPAPAPAYRPDPPSSSPAPAPASRPLPPAPAPAPAPAPESTSPPPAAASPVPTAPAAAAASRSAARVYSVDDEGVSPPIPLEQRIPAMTNEMQLITKALRTSGILDVVIDETGRVVDATIRQSLNSSFDTLIVRTARRWKYRPAMKDGVPVRFVKTLVLVP